eukprot:GHVU01200331.1.p1 GENE.GHVU01200331.1~~GHVU01200331.1.p1  ORF type:complete len:112 (-),score=12.62 GHVU01200331.1:10-345(-)
MIQKKVVAKLEELAEDTGAKLGLGLTVREEHANAASFTGIERRNWQMRTHTRGGGQMRASGEGCGRCGANHRPGLDNCRAKGQECYKCGRSNHFARVCTSQAPLSQPPPII